MANDQGTFLAYQNFLENTETVFTTDVDIVGSRDPKNVLTRESDDFWRVSNISVEDTSAMITAAMTADNPIDVVSIQFTRGEYAGVSESEPNFTDGDTIHYRLLNDSDEVLWDSGILTGDIIAGYMTHYVKLTTTVNARKLQINFDAPSRISAGFFDVGNIGAWSAIEPNVGFAYPAKFGWRTNKESQRTSAGRLYTARFEPMRRWALVFDRLTSSESMIMDEMVRYAGGARQIFVKRGDLPVGRDAMLAIIAADTDFDSVTPDILQHTLTLDEFI